MVNIDYLLTSNPPKNNSKSLPQAPLKAQNPLLGVGFFIFNKGAKWTAKPEKAQGIYWKGAKLVAELFLSAYATKHPNSI